MSQIQTIVKTLKPSNGVDVATGMTTPIDDRNSDWTYSMKISTGPAYDVRLALLSGGITQQRIAQVSTGGLSYKGIGLNISGYGSPESILIEDASVSENEFLLLQDSPELINKIMPTPATIVATNPILKKAYQKNILYADGKSQVMFDSTMNAIGPIDVFRELLRDAALRLVETQITTDSDEQILRNIMFAHLSGTKNPVFTPIPLDNFYIPGALQRKMVVKKTMYFDNNTFFLIDIPKGTTTTLTWKFSHMLSSHKLLQDKTNYENIIQKLIS